MLSELKKYFTTCGQSVIILTHGPNIHMGIGHQRCVIVCRRASGNRCSDGNSN